MSKGNARSDNAAISCFASLDLKSSGTRSTADNPLITASTYQPRQRHQASQVTISITITSGKC